MPNTKTDRAAVLARLQRLDGLSGPQRTSLSEVLSVTLLRTMSDGELATLVNAQIPTLPVNPDQGLPLGLPGATQLVRFVGGTTAGAPLTGDFLVGDFVISRADGLIYVCTAAGTPGTWATSTGGSGGLTTAQVQAIVAAMLVCN